MNKDQTCGVPGRFIGENVALLRDVIEYASSSETLIAILSLDQEKAFDRVDWAFMVSTLSAMGFGPSFISWVSLFYNHVQSSVNVNGYLSPFFGLLHGVRQGCPLSPLLYVLVSEVLAVNICCNPRISVSVSLVFVFFHLSPSTRMTRLSSLRRMWPLKLFLRIMLCSRRPLVRGLTSPSPKVSGWAAGLVAQTPLSIWTGPPPN